MDTPLVKPLTVCGSRKPSNPVSGSGLTAMIVAPFAFAPASALSIRG